MLPYDKIPDDEKAKIPERVARALQSFTDEELEPVCMFFEHETGLFWGLGFTNEDNKVCKFANMEKYEALSVIEDYVRTRLEDSGHIYQDLSQVAAHFSSFPRAVYYSRGDL